MSLGVFFKLNLYLRKRWPRRIVEGSITVVWCTIPSSTTPSSLKEPRWNRRCFVVWKKHISQGFPRVSLGFFYKMSKEKNGCQTTNMHWKLASLKNSIVFVLSSCNVFVVCFWPEWWMGFCMFSRTWNFVFLHKKGCDMIVLRSFGKTGAIFLIRIYPPGKDLMRALFKMTWW